MAQQRSEERPGLPTEYYAPEFELVIENQKLDQSTRGDVLEIKVVLEMRGIATADLTINNWDDRAFGFKHSDGQTFDIGNRVHIRLGYGSRLLSMMRGRIMAISPRFPEAGPPTMQVHVAGAMVRMRDAKQPDGKEKRYAQVFDWEIAERIAERNNLKSKVTKKGPRHKLVVQKNQSDLSFLKERAERIDFEAFVHTDPESGDETLHFVERTDGRSAEPIKVYKLVWGESLIEFSPVLSLTRQVSKVTVRAWDPDAKQPITGTATHKDLPQGPAGAKSGPELATEKVIGRTKEEVVVAKHVLTQEEADELAKALLAKRSYKFLEASGRVIGLPDLRPGDNLDLVGLGTRFSGTYYVRKVEHTLGNAGYTTHFDVQRQHDPGAARKGTP
jgi:phage protein D